MNNYNNKGQESSYRVAKLLIKIITGALARQKKTS